MSDLATTTPRVVAVDRPSGGYMLTCRGLTKRFGELSAVDDLAFRIAPGVSRRSSPRWRGPRTRRGTPKR